MYTQEQAKGGVSEQDAASKLAAIESMKEKLKAESETLKALRAQLKLVIAQQQSEKAVPSLAQTAGTVWI